MEDKNAELERLIETKLVHVDALSFAVVTGLVAGAGLFVATNWLLLKGGSDPGPHLALLGQYFLGYRVTFAGSLVGFAYASVAGFVSGYAGARLYNWVAGRRGASP